MRGRASVLGFDSRRLHWMGSAAHVSIPSRLRRLFFCQLYAEHAMGMLRLALQDRRHVLYNLVQAFFPGAAIDPHGHLGGGMPRKRLGLFHGSSRLNHQINIRQSDGVQVELLPDGFLGNARALQVGIERPGRVGSAHRAGAHQGGPVAIYGHCGHRAPWGYPALANAYRSSTKNWGCSG